MRLVRLPIAAIVAVFIVLGGAPVRAGDPITFGDFGMRLFGQLTTATPDKNVVVSPLSAGLALSMAYDGAVGPTATEMGQTLGLAGMSTDELDGVNATLLRSLADQSGVDLESADGLWIDNSRREQPYPQYIKRITSMYGSRVQSANFRNPSTVDTINDWVARATHGKIERILDHLDNEAALVLLNACYFKGLWALRFDASKTTPEDFTLPGGATIKSPRMTATDQFDYFETPEFQAVRMPYKGNRFAMEVFLPTRNIGLRTFELGMTGAQLTEWQNKFSGRQGTLELPRFSLQWRSSLKSALNAMGMRTAFSKRRAQSYKMYPRGPEVAYIQDVDQATSLTVDEQGSEATSTTGIIVGVHPVAVVIQPPPFQMIVDRPFFCAILDLQTGAPLFFAAINDPRSGS